MASRVDLRTFRLVEESFPGEWKAYISMPSAWRNYGETWEGFGKTFGYQLVCGKFSTEEAATAACDKAARETSMEEWDQAVRRLAAMKLFSSRMDYPTEPEVTDFPTILGVTDYLNTPTSGPEVTDFPTILGVTDYLNTPTSGPERIFKDGDVLTKAMLKKLLKKWSSDFDTSSGEAATVGAGKPIHVSNDSHAVPLDIIEAKSQNSIVETQAQSSVGPGLSEAELEQLRKRTSIQTKLQVKRVERLGRSSDIADVATTYALKHLHPVAEKYGVKDWVIHDGGTGTEDPLAADSRMQNVFERLSQAGFIPTTWVDKLQNLTSVELPMYVRWKESVFRKLRKIWTMQFGGPEVQKFTRVIFKMVLSMLLFDNFPAKVGAIAPEPTREGTLPVANSDSSTSNFAFGIVAAIGVLFTILQVFLSMKCWRRPPPVRTVERFCYEKIMEEGL